jgi:hypothetical protein
MPPDPVDAGWNLYARRQEASAGAALVWAWLRPRYGVVIEFRLPHGVRAWHIQQPEPARPFEVRFTIPALESSDAHLQSWLEEVATHAAGADAAVEPDYYRVTSQGVAVLPGSAIPGRSPEAT